MWVILVLLGFAAYVQFSPTMGHIWLRRNDENKWVFVPDNLWNLMCAPLNHLSFWYPSMWIINVFVWLLFGWQAVTVLRHVWDAGIIWKRG
jgi:hypothetical protein